MRCTECAFENPAAQKFCGQCGRQLQRRCGGCGAHNPPQFKFCGGCGATLNGKNGSSAATEGTESAVDGERRHLTALFSDLASSTEIAAQLDPEEWRDLAAEYQRSAAAAIARFGGHVANFLGDGVVAYFGWPEAHDDDADRAVRAGLAIVEAIAAQNLAISRKYQFKLAVRIGIDSGAVVVSEGGDKRAEVFGEAPNVAARVQAIADPDSVFITAAVHQLVSGLFVVEERPAQPLKGIARAVRLFRVVRSTGMRNRLQAAVPRGLTRLVGREHELRLLANRWEMAREGAGQMVLIVGEAGIGKSRLVHEFRNRLAGTPHTWIEAVAAPFFHNTPFYVLTDMLRQSFGGQEHEPAEQRLQWLTRSMEAAGLNLPEALPLVAPLLNLSLGDSPPLSVLSSPEPQRKRLFATLAAWVFGAARAQPVVIATEDLHWADPSTLELIHILVEQGATAPLLMLYTARPEFHAPWPMRAHHAQISLNRLNAPQIREMVGAVAAREVLARDAVDAVVSRTGGVPLFVEEITRAILESGGRQAPREIPATLQASLMARLDRLGAAKEVAQVAVVIGQEFSYELLHAVSPMAEPELQAALGRLADAELIYARGIAPDATYQFKHALIQDVAYEALLKSRRRELHRRVARAITDRFPALTQAQPEVVARHWTEAGDTEPAIEAWRKAAKAARQRRAFKEAQEDYEQALALIETMEESPRRDAWELDLVSALGHVLALTKGFSAPERVDAHERARRLAEKSGNLGQLVFQQFGMMSVVVSSGDFRAAATLADQLLDLAQQEGGPATLGLAHHAQVTVRYLRGDLTGAEDYFTRGIPFFAAPAFRQASPGVAANVFGGAASSIAWLLGYADKARERSRQAIEVARETGNPFDMATAQSMASLLYVMLRDPTQAEACAAQALEISEKNGFPFYAGMTKIALGWARANLGRADEGVALINQGLDGYYKTGARASITRYLTDLAQAQALAGSVDDAAASVEAALQANPDDLEHRPETLRLRGELRLQQEQAELAEADFRDAIALAQKMKAKAWELRGSMSLARLLRSRGDGARARALLAPVYASFTEGFDTVDLAEAKTQLDDSAQSS